MTQVRESWSSCIGFIFSSIGSAIGIEDIWRFPHVAGMNGGGTFLITYIIILFTLALPLDG